MHSQLEESQHVTSKTGGYMPGAIHSGEGGHPWFAHYEPEVPATMEAPHITLPHFFEETVREHPGAIATIFFGRRLTYAQLDAQANCFAAGLQALGVAPGDRVALVLPNCPQFLVGLYGGLKAGALMVPLNPAYVERELKNAFNDSGVETVVTLNTIAPRAQEVMADTGVKRLIVTSMQDSLSSLMSLMLTVQERRDGTTVNVQGDDVYLYSDLLKNNPPEYKSADMSPEDTAVLLYTGGTTGTPKGAMLSHRNLVSNALQMRSWVWDLRPEKHEVFLSVIPFFHSYGMTVVMNLAISVAGAMLLMPRFNMKDTLRAIARFRPTVFPAVPTIYNAIANHPLSSRYDLRSIRVCISGAAPLPVEVAQAFESVTGARLVEGYGLTESSPVTHCNPVYGERRAGSIGLPIPLTEARIVNSESLEPLSVGEVGELAVRGPQVMQGYWAQPKETESVIKGGWLLTGDMARMDEDGYFYVVDRKKDLILVNGLNVYPREVEEVLYENDSVQEAVVAGVPDRRKGESVKAYVVLRPDAEISDRELRSFCAERLAPYKVPSRIEFRESLPKTGIGKYLRRQLVEEEAGKRGK